MEWSEEKYVKLYSRDTVTWLSWPWQARALWPLLMRKLDGAGLIETGSLDPAAAVAMVVGLPVEVVAVGIEALVGSGTLERVDRGLLASKFLEGQEARKSDALRARESRERRRRDSKPTESGYTASHAVTPRHTPSHRVTLQPSPAQPSPSPAAAVAERQSQNDWDGPEDFWNWFQSLRRKAGCVREKPPHPSALSKFWAEALGELNGNPEPLREAVFRFGDDKFWQAKDPPCPFGGFVAVWPKYVPRGSARVS